MEHTTYKEIEEIKQNQQKEIELQRAMAELVYVIAKKIDPEGMKEAMKENGS